MKAMILAAGLGTRLKPITDSLPKCMIPIAGKPLILHQIMWLKKNWINEIIINLHYLPKKVIDYLGNGKRLGVKISYSDESEKLMGTAGGVKKAEDFFDDTFLVYYGDAFTNFDLKEMIDFHVSKSSFLTICIKERQNNERISNLFRFDKDNRILSFKEKPEKQDLIGFEGKNIENCGIYLCNKDILKKIPKNTFFDFAYDLFPKLVEEERVYGYTLPDKYYWCELGKLEKYMKHKEEIERLLANKD
jgi:NDP-sugar pyrophosphorylase family protein